MNINIDITTISNNGHKVNTNGTMEVHNAMNMLRQLNAMRYTAIITTPNGHVITIQNWYIIRTGRMAMTINL